MNAQLSIDKETKLQTLKYLVQCAYDGHNAKNNVRFVSCWNKIVDLMKEIGDDVLSIVGENDGSKQGLQHICAFYGFNANKMDRKVGL